jgi:hypothetical protein
MASPGSNRGISGMGDETRRKSRKEEETAFSTEMVSSTKISRAWQWSLPVDILGLAEFLGSC